MEKPLDLLKNFFYRCFSYAPLIDDTVIYIILSTRHKYAGTKSILEMRG